MKKESTALYVVRLALTLLIITGVVAACLAGVNAITEDRIAAIKAEKVQKAIAEVLNGAADYETVELTGDTGIVKTVYSSDAGYAVEVAPSGFGGEITMMVGVSTDGKVLGISVVSHTETAGLGSVAADKGDKGIAFRDSFVGLSGTVSVSKDGGEADTIASATITSRAVADGVNAALAWVADNG